MGTIETQVLRSTIKWAEKETWDAIRKSNAPASIACEEFVRKMDEYSCRNKATSVFFSIAKDVALSILDDILIGGNRR